MYIHIEYYNIIANKAVTRFTHSSIVYLLWSTVCW